MLKKYVELLKNSAVFGIGLIGAKFVQFFMLPYFTNVFSKSEYGVIDLSLTLIELLVPVMTLQLSSAVLRFGLANDTDKKSLIKCSLVILGVSCAAILMLSPALRFYKTLEQWRWLVIILLTEHCIREQCTIFVKSQERVSIYALDNFLIALVTAVLDIICISGFRLGIQGYFLSEIIGYISSIVFLISAGGIYKYVDIRLKTDHRLLKSMLGYSAPLVLNGISWWITSFSDRAVLDFYFGEGQVGLYAIAAKFPSLMAAVLAVFIQAWVISAVKEYESDKRSRFFDHVYSVYTALLFIAVSAGILVIRPVMNIYVGAEFSEAWIYDPVLLIGAAFLGISNYLGAVFSASKKNVLEMKSTILCAVTNIILNFVLIPRYNIMGAAAATMISYIVLYVIRFVYSGTIVFFNKYRMLSAGMNAVILLGEAVGMVRGNVMFSCGCAGVCMVVNVRPLIQSLAEIKKNMQH